MASLRVLAMDRPVATASAHALSPDGLQLALARDRDIHVFYRTIETWDWVQEGCMPSGSHSQQVASLDWAGSGVASCAHDAGAVVWTRRAQGDTRPTWTPDLVVTRLSHAALCTRWCPAGRKLALGCVDGAVMLCYHDRQRGLFAPRPLRRACSPDQGPGAVFSVAWHPGGLALATADVAGTVRVLAAGLAETGDVPLATQQSPSPGTVLLETRPVPGAWTAALAWSPNGTTLAVALSGSATAGSCAVFLEGLPEESAPSAAQLAAAASDGRRVELGDGAAGLTCLAFLDENTLVGAGFAGRPAVLRRGKTMDWALVHLNFDTAELGKAGATLVRQPLLERNGAAAAGQPSTLAQKIRMFELAGLDREGTGSCNPGLPAQLRPGQGRAAATLPIPEAPGHTSHVCSLSAVPGHAGVFLTVGLDGRVIAWQLCIP